MKNFIVSFACISFLFACDAEQKEQELQNEVIGKHDEVMPLMGTIMEEKNRLREKIDSLNASGSNNVRQVEYLQNHIENLRKADSAMMTWMRQFRAIKDSAESNDERMEYLQNEKDRIEKVQQMMEQAIDESQSL